MKKLLLFILNFCFVAAMGQNVITPITIKLPANPPANTAEWATAIPPLIIMAQTRMSLDSGMGGYIRDSRILVSIKSGSNKICGTYTEQTAPSSNFNSMVKTWSGTAALSLLGQDCILKAGMYELCVQFFYFGPAGPKILGEACKTFTIADTKQQTYSPPQNTIPVNGKVITEQEANMPIMFRWTPVLPKPQGDVLYKLRLIEILPGQNKTEALRTNTPFDILEVKNSTQASYKLSKRITGLFWEIEAESAERRQGEKPRSYGKSEATSIMMSFAGCGTNTDSIKISCEGVVNGVPAYTVSIIFKNIIPVSGGQQCTTVMNNITSSTGIISGIATLPVTIPVGGSSPAVTFTYTPFVSGATTASFSYLGIWNDGNSNTSNFSHNNVVLPSCGCTCGNWSKIDVYGKIYGCGETVKWYCNKTFSFKTNYHCNPTDSSCKALTSWEIKNGTTTIKTGTGISGISDSFTPTANGTYTITLHATCSGKECPPCTLTVIVDDCKTCDCGKWGPIVINGKKYQCGEKINWSCNKPLAFGASYYCDPVDSTCKAITNWEIRNGTTLIKTGNGSNLINDVFTPTANGVYTITMYANCNGIKCVACTFTVIVDDCPTCDCGKWAPIVINGKKYQCGEKINWSCNKPLAFGASYYCDPVDSACKAITNWEIRNGTTLIKTGNGSNLINDVFTPTANGIYTITMYANCNGIKCVACTFTVIVDDCDPCQCGDWVLFVVDGKQYKCGEKFKWPCKKSLTFNGTYKCSPDDKTCKAITTWEIKNGNTTVKTGTGANGFSDAFTPTANGNYTITMRASCNGKVCDSCVITAIVDDCPGCDCGTWGPIKYGYKKGDKEQPWKSGDCGSTITAEKGYPYTFTSYLSCKPSTECKPDSSMVTVYDESGQAIYSTAGPMLKDFVFEKCGKYQVVFTAYCGGNKCKCVLNIDIPCCECKGPSTILLAGEAGDPLELKCDSDKKVMINCNRKYALTAYADCSGPDCKSKVLISINGPGTNIVNAVGPLTFTLTQNGFYTATITAICGTDTCEPCKIIFVVDNCMDCCKDSKWGTKTWQGIPTPVKCNTSLVEIFPVGSVRTVNYTFNCYTGCKAQIRYDVLDPATGTVLSSVTAYSGTNRNITMPSASGKYCLVAYGICDGKICDSCTVCFRTTCENCDKVKITDNTVHINGGSHLSINGSIITPGLNLVSKVTAQLVSFSAENYPMFAPITIPVPNFEFALGISQINGVGVAANLPFSLTGARSNIAVSNGAIAGPNIPFDLRVDNYTNKRFRHYRVKFTIYFADGSYCEKEIQRN